MLIALAYLVAITLVNAKKFGHSPKFSKLSSQTDDDWWYKNRFGGEAFASNPYYKTYQQIMGQMDAYGPATHVGKINRGQLFDPDLNSPGDRAFGFQSDFNPDDYVSGAFNFAPKQQKVRATNGMIKAGFADKLGEIISLPNYIEVNDDGSVLVQTNTKYKHPCDPNPCERYTLNKICSIVDRTTAKCSSVSSVTISVEWGVTDDDEDLDLYMRPAWINGTDCETDDFDWDYLRADEEACGGIVSEDTSFDYDLGNRVKEYTVLTTTNDGINFRDLTYAVGVYGEDIDLERTVFHVKIGDTLVQSILVPQDEDGEDGSNMDLDSDYSFYFVGCFHPHLGYIDTTGSGYYDEEYTDIFDGSGFDDADLCFKLLSHPGPSGFNVNTYLEVMP